MAGPRGARIGLVTLSTAVHLLFLFTAAPGLIKQGGTSLPVVQLALQSQAPVPVPQPEPSKEPSVQSEPVSQRPQPPDPPPAVVSPQEHPTETAVRPLPLPAPVVPSEPMADEETTVQKGLERETPNGRDVSADAQPDSTSAEVSPRSVKHETRDLDRETDLLAFAGDPVSLGIFEGTFSQGEGFARAHAIRLPRPDYPMVSRRRGEEGQVVLEVTVGADGTVLDFRLGTSSGFERLDRAALAAIRDAAFSPATSFGAARQSVRRVTYIFRLEER